MLKTLLTTVAALALTGSVWAQSAASVPVPDSFSVNYYANANMSGYSDGTVRITNPGTSSVPGIPGNLCAMIYVFSPDQQMAECCGCYLTPDGLRTLSVNSDLTSNSLTGVTLYTGAIKIVSSTPSGSVCDPRTLHPTAALRSWATHIQNTLGAITETESLDSTLSAAEQTRLQNVCRGIIGNGSGHGICSCGTGD